MAEAFLQVLLDNLSSLIDKEIGLIVGADKEMKKLSSTLTTIQAVLEDAEDRQFESKPIQIWLRKLSDLAFEIDDLLDECGIEVSKLQKKNNKFFSLKKILLQRKIGRSIKEVVDKLDDVAAERKKFHLRESEREKHAEAIARRLKHETGSVLNESGDVLGRDEEKEKIVDILVNHVKGCQQLSILPIIGLGGMGKTTLARLVYNDIQITEHFDLKIWVCVSDDFDPKALVEAMLKSTTGTGNASDSMPLDALQRHLWELLNMKRYLLIMDDVWNEDQEKWAMLKNVLACGSRGASIVVTTRLKKVADVMGTLPAHCLKGLSGEHCWLLFKQRAFGQEEEEHPNLESIGRQIVKKCAGVPLAATTLGGLLRFKRKEKEWIHIKESKLWSLEQKETSILPSLKLSYRHLPLVLRRCFAYCALFPKDRIIEKEELIHLWASHGCISSNGMQEVEDVGDDVWNELVLRSLFQEVRMHGRRTTCKMHDLVHDLALSVMENQVPGTLANNSPTQSIRKIRQVQVRELSRFTFLEKLREVHGSGLSSTLPTSIQLQVSTFTSSAKFSSLRMLAGQTHEKALPSSIGKLKQLRSLDLSSSNIQALPNTICGLQKLQILNLSRCCNLMKLPKNLRYMDSLRHLFLEGCDSLIEMPSKIGDLTSLKTLSQFIVGDKIGNRLGELEHLNLGGLLEIKHLERVKNQIDAKIANLSEKPNLCDLVLKWEGDNSSESREMMDKMVLEVLEPHPNIEGLNIFGFRGNVFPLWMGNSIMNNVVWIEIHNCPNCLHLPPLGYLPQLKSLYLGELDKIEFIMEDEVESGKSFPSLENLRLWSLPNLKGFSKKEGREMFPNLQSLSITDCPSVRLPPVLPSLEELQVYNCSNSILSSLCKHGNLTSLHVTFDDENMTYIPKEALENLSNLKKLDIRNPPEHCLPAEALQSLKSLTHMVVTCLPEEWFQHLTTLEDLQISHAKEIEEIPDGIKYLHSLKSLTLHYFPKLGCLPEGLQHLHSLERLHLDGLHQLTSLPDWLDKLASLHYLFIQSCPRIASLPSNIQRMTDLQTLEIKGCCSAELKRRCEEGTGEDWHIIAHIPHVGLH